MPDRRRLNMLGGNDISSKYTGSDARNPVLSTAPPLPPARPLVPADFQRPFSICTLVTDHVAYDRMRQSFRRAGFTETDTEYLYLDNSAGNVADGYAGLNHFLRAAVGRYVIICHQDVALDFDDRAVLERCIADMDARDPDWAVLGNAGYGDFAENLCRVSDPWGDNRKHGGLPCKARSLDENFLVVKNAANLALSHDLQGFHLYATDLCAIARILGWNSYVVDFHLRHMSGGYGSEKLLAAKRSFIAKYARHVKPFALRTQCTQLIVTGSALWNRILNRGSFYSLKYRLDAFFRFFRGRRNRAEPNGLR
jgi:hypothetical protein